MRRTPGFVLKAPRTQLTRTPTMRGDACLRHQLLSLLVNVTLTGYDRKTSRELAWTPTARSNTRRSVRRRLGRARLCRRSSLPGRSRRVLSRDRHLPGTNSTSQSFRSDLNPEPPVCLAERTNPLLGSVTVNTRRVTVLKLSSAPVFLTPPLSSATDALGQMMFQAARHSATCD